MEATNVKAAATNDCVWRLWLDSLTHLCFSFHLIVLQTSRSAKTRLRYFQLFCLCQLRCIPTIQSHHIEYQIFGILHQILLYCSVPIVGTSRLVLLSGNIKTLETFLPFSQTLLWQGPHRTGNLFSIHSRPLSSAIWWVSYGACLLCWSLFLCSTPFDCFVAGSKSCSVQRQENGRPTVKFRSTLLSALVCSKTRTQILK